MTSTTAGPTPADLKALAQRMAGVATDNALDALQRSTSVWPVEHTRSQQLADLAVAQALVAYVEAHDFAPPKAQAPAPAPEPETSANASGPDVWVVQRADGGCDYVSDSEEATRAQAAFWDEVFPLHAPHRVVRYTPARSDGVTVWQTHSPWGVTSYLDPNQTILPIALPGWTQQRGTWYPDTDTEGGS